MRRPTVCPGRASWTGWLLALALTVLGPGWRAPAAPRAPGPPLPSMGMIYHEGFDEPYSMPTNQIDASVYADSWSGYALNRSGQYPEVAPWLIPMVDTNGAVKVDSRGAMRLWYRPEFSSGSGPGSPAELLSLVTTNGAVASEVWSLIISADGSELELAVDSQSGPMVSLSVPVAFQAGNWHLITLGYTETNSALFLGEQELGRGSGLPAVPVLATPYSSLVVGGLPGNVAAGQMDELTIFSGHYRFGTLLGHEFGLSRTWDIESYYTNVAPVAALGPLSEAEWAARQQARAQRLAQAPAAAPAPPATRNRSLGPLNAGPDCATGGPVYLTNVAAALDPVYGWSVSVQLAGGTNGLGYDLMMSPALGSGSLTNWPWVYLGQGYTCNLYTFTNQPAQGGCYLAGDASADPDGEGLGSLFELLISHTDPTRYSTRGDGLSDQVAYLQGRNPSVPGSVPDNSGLVHLQVYTPLNW